MNAGADLLAADDSKFLQLWADMEDDERAAIPPAERAECFARKRKLSSYVEASVKSAERAQAAKAPARRTLPRVWLEDATEHARGRGPVKGIIGPGELAVVYGPSGSGKTFMTLDLVGHVATATPWRGRRTSGGVVVYVAAEAGLSILRRFVAWRDRTVPEGREARVPLAVITRGVNLLFPVELEEFAAELRVVVDEAGPLAMVVFDTLSRSIPGGDENGPDMTKVVAAADRIRDEFGAATLIVHHTGKDATKGARGSSALVAAADTVLAVVDRVATVEKVRDGVAGETFAFTLDVVDMGTDEDGDPITTCIAIPTTNAPGASAARPTAQRLTGAAKIVLQALREAIDEHGERLPGTSTIPDGVRGVRIGKWRERFQLRYGGEGEEARRADAIDKAFRRGYETLAQAGAVQVSKPYAWIPR